MFKNGGLVRGTISELVPDDYVLIVTVTGQSRRIAMTEVNYAGPTEGAPARSTVPVSKPTEPTVRPMVTVRAQEAPISLKAKDPGVTFYWKSGFSNIAHPDGIRPLASKRRVSGFGARFATLEAVGFDTTIVRLIRDRDGLDGAAFDTRVNNLGIRQIKIARAGPAIESPRRGRFTKSRQPPACDLSEAKCLTTIQACPADD